MFKFDWKGVTDEVTLYLGGTGYASFDNIEDYAGFKAADVLARNTLSMEWEADHTFAGNRPDWGIVHCRARARDKSDTRSGLVMISENADSLYPATMVNTLFCEIEVPGLDVVMFNKDPIVLRGRVQNLDAELIRKDPRFKKFGKAGLPKPLEAMLSGKENIRDFNPIGTHSLAEKEVAFYNKANPLERVATLRSSVVQTMPHYGLDLEIVESELDGKVINVTWEARNRLFAKTGVAEEVSWYVDDSHEIRLVTDRTGRITLGKDPVRITAQAVNEHPERALMGAESDLLLTEACMFCGLQNTPTSLDLIDFRTAFSYTDIGELRARQ